MTNHTYIYIAIRRGPMAVPESATDVFDVEINTTDLQSGTDLPATNMTTDLMISHWRDGNYGPFAIPRLTGGRGIYVFRDTSEFTSFFDMGFKQTQIECTGNFDTTSSPRVYWHWKRAPSFCDVVAYTGNGTAGRTVSHNLGVAPEMMWVKCRTNTYSWSVYHKGCNGGVNPEQYRLVLNDTFAETANSTRWNDTAPTESVFTLGTATQGNASGEDYIAYLFASLDGVSKVGSYTGDSTTGRVIDCGFTSGARFVLIKRTDGAGDWYVFDTERGITTSVAYSLSLNSTAAQTPTGSPTQDYHDRIDPHSSGFIVNHTAASAVNESGQSYIFYAIA